MRIRFVRTSVFSLAISCIAQAQQPAAPTPNPASPVAAAPAPATPAATGEGSQAKPSDTSTALDYLFNRKPQDGSAGQKAMDANQKVENKAIADDAVGTKQGDPQLRARFEQYLGTAEVPKE